MTWILNVLSFVLWVRILVNVLCEHKKNVCSTAVKSPISIRSSWLYSTDFLPTGSINYWGGEVLTYLTIFADFSISPLSSIFFFFFIYFKTLLLGAKTFSIVILSWRINSFIITKWYFSFLVISFGLKCTLPSVNIANLIHGNCETIRLL